jgi:hypothetical protein
MNYQSLRDELLSSPRAVDYAPYVVTNDAPKQNAYAKDKALADILNTPSGTRLIERYLNAVLLMGELGATTGAAILDKLEIAAASNPVLKWTFVALNSEKGLDFGHPETQAYIDELATATILTAQEASALKALGSAPSSRAFDLIGRAVTASDISIALRFNAEFQGA